MASSLQHDKAASWERRRFTSALVMTRSATMICHELGAKAQCLMEE